MDRELERAILGLSETRVLDGLRWTNFFLAYQGQDDRSLQRAYAADRPVIIDIVTDIEALAPLAV